MGVSRSGAYPAGGGALPRASVFSGDGYFPELLSDSSLREIVGETVEHLILAWFDARGLGGLPREDLLAGVRSEPRTAEEKHRVEAVIERLEREGLLESTAE